MRQWLRRSGKKLNEWYEGKGQQTVAYLIGELFCGTLSNNSEMELQLNAMCQKAYVLKSLSQPLDNLLVAIMIIISLPSSYSTLQTILMSTVDKLATDSIVLQILIEEKSQKVSQSTLVTKGPTKDKTKDKPKDKGKEKTKERRLKKKCDHCRRTHGGECFKKMADNAIKSALGSSSSEKDKSKNMKDKPELTTKLMNITSNDESPLQLFMVCHLNSSSHTPFEWIVDSGASANMTCQHSWFMSFHGLTPLQPVIISNG